MPCAGYRETLGEDAVVAHFQHWLDLHDTTAARVQVSEAHINSFLESLLALEFGGRGPVESEDEEPGFAGALTQAAAAERGAVSSLSRVAAPLLLLRQ